MSAPTAGQFVQWDQAASDPIDNVAQWILDFRQLTGFAPNFCVMGAYVMKSLKNHPDIIDRIKYTQRGIVTEDLIATLFDIDELFVELRDGGHRPANPGRRPAGRGRVVRLHHQPQGRALRLRARAPSLLTPSAGYTFTWKGYLGGNGQGIRVNKFRMENIKSDRVEAEQTYDMKVVCNDMGLFASAVVA